MVAIAEKYYRFCESAYLNLCPEQSGYMNMGLWPASSIKESQQLMIDELISFALKSSRSEVFPDSILDFGCGWGGPIHQYLRAFPDSRYVGYNISRNQIEFAKSRYSNSRIEFRCEDIDKIQNPNWYGNSLALFSESAFHLSEKENLFEIFSRNSVRWVGMAEITSRDALSIQSQKYLKSAFTGLWSLEKYHRVFESLGYRVGTHSIGEIVFDGWFEFIRNKNKRSDSQDRLEKRMLNQFAMGFESMANGFHQGLLDYNLIFAERLLENEA